MTLKSIAALTFGGLLTMSAPASADLIYLGTTETHGSGLGDQLTLLSFGATGSDNTTASAAIVADGTNDLVIEGPGTQINGGANNQMWTLGDAGILDGSEFRLVWNQNEPSPDGVVTLLDLSAAFYAQDGTLLHVANLDTSTCPTLDCTFTEVAGGIGGEGHVFGLSAQQASDLNLFANFADIRVGVGTELMLASFTGDEGGYETFNLTRYDGGDNQTIPEPSLLLLFGAALVGAGSAMRKRQ